MAVFRPTVTIAIVGVVNRQLKGENVKWRLSAQKKQEVLVQKSKHSQSTTAVLLGTGYDY